MTIFKFNIPFLIIRDADAMNVEERTNNLLSEMIKVGRDLSQEQINRIKSSIFIADKYSIEGYFIDELFLKSAGISTDILNGMMKCYNCQYDHFCNSVATQNDRKRISNWYQPKHLLENFEDKFKVNDEGRKKLADEVTGQMNFGSNMRGSAAYREQLSKVLLRRGFEQLEERREK